MPGGGRERDVEPGCLPLPDHYPRPEVGKHEVFGVLTAEIEAMRTRWGGKYRSGETEGETCERYLIN